MTRTYRLPASERAARGRRAETLVARYLTESGFELVGRNVRVGRFEIDLIARRRTLLVFCEVRSRSSAAYGSPVESIRTVKVDHVRWAAARWLAEHRPRFSELRFDAAAVVFDRARGPHLDYFEDAF